MLHAVKYEVFSMNWQVQGVSGIQTLELSSSILEALLQNL